MIPHPPPPAAKPYAQSTTPAFICSAIHSFDALNASAITPGGAGIGPGEASTRNFIRPLLSATHPNGLGSMMPPGVGHFLPSGLGPKVAESKHKVSMPSTKTHGEFGMAETTS